MQVLDKIKEICDGIEDFLNIPEEAKKLAKENSIIIVTGTSDFPMYCYGADCYMTEKEEHLYGWDGGDTLQNIDDKQLEAEAEQIGLMIWSDGKIVNTNLKKENYDTLVDGEVSFSVKEGIDFREFKVTSDDVREHYLTDNKALWYGGITCTGIIIKLPDDFKSSK